MNLNNINQQNSLNLPSANQNPHGRYPFGHPMEFSTNVLFIGDLASFCTEEHIDSIFRSEGFRIADAKVVRGKSSMQSLNYGFVQMRSAIEAQNAIGALDGKLFYGRKIRVSWSKPNAKGAKTNEGVNSVHVKFHALKVSYSLTDYLSYIT